MNKIMASICLCLMLLVTTSCNEARVDWIPTKANPPIRISHRSSMLYGYVLRVTNTSNKNIACNLFVQNQIADVTGEHEFTVSPGLTYEIGSFEMDWCFWPGESGYIQVDGYTPKLYFDIEYGGVLYEFR